MIGAGLLGGAVILHLALLRVRLIIVDPGLVDLPNIGNQFLAASRVGEPKVDVRADQVREYHPDGRVRVHQARIEDLGLGALADADLIYTGLDSRASRVRAAEISQRLAIPHIDAAVDGSGERLQGTVTYYDPKRPGAACYGCRYDSDAFAKIRSEGGGPGCPSWRNPEAPKTPPTLAASAFGGVVAGHSAIWIT